MMTTLRSAVICHLHVYTIITGHSWTWALPCLAYQTLPQHTTKLIILSYVVVCSHYKGVKPCPQISSRQVETDLPLCTTTVNQYWASWNDTADKSWDADHTTTPQFKAIHLTRHVTCTERRKLPPSVALAMCDGLWTDLADVASSLADNWGH